MRKTLLFMSLFLTMTLCAYPQSPNMFNYQAVVRDNNGELITNTDIGIRISILDASNTGALLFKETHTTATDSYGVINIKVGAGSNVAGNLNKINWSSNKKFLKVEIDESGGTSYTEMGTVQLLSVPYASYANTAGKLGDDNIYTSGSDTLFVVKDYNGNVVFAVFPDGAAVYVNEQAKGKVGGFAVSGRNPSKATETDFLRVTQDSTRIFVSDTVNSKGKVGGFAVSGRNPSKSAHNDILFVTADSTRIYVNDDVGTKGKVGGFAVSGRNPSKGEVSSLMDITKENYFIGHEAGKNNTTGLYNTFLGYNTGYFNSRGNNNIYIGQLAGYWSESGTENIFIGVESGYHNTSGDLNTCVGFQSGYHLDTARYNTFLGFWAGKGNKNGELNTYLGAQAGEFALDGDLNVIIGAYAGSEDTIGNFNTFVGMRAGSKNTGDNNTIMGGYAGKDNADGNFNVFIGQASGELNNGSRNVFVGNGTGYLNDGDRNVFIGNDAGSSIKGSDKLIISNFDADSSQALIYGEFDNQYLRFNGVLDGLRFINSFQVDSNYISEGNYMAFGHNGVSEDFIGYKSNAFYFLDSPDGGDVLDPDVIIGGKVGIGVLAPSEKLEVDGNIRVTAGGAFVADATNLDVPDYVFKSGYQLESIEEHALFMWKNNHLPALSSAQEIKNSDGYNISERREQILEELEKAHIYIDQLNHEIKKLKEQNNLLMNKFDELEQKLAE